MKNNGFKLDFKGSDEEQSQLQEAIEDFPFDISFKRGKISRLLGVSPRIEVAYGREGHVTFYPHGGSISVNNNGFRIRDTPYRSSVDLNGIMYDIWHTS